MKALVYDGPGKIQYREHPMPVLQADTDILMKVSESTICGTDLHIIKGGVPTVRPGTVLGHEATGVVTEVGDSVKNIAVGDRVLAVCVSACGYCRFCTSGMYGQCLNGGWALGNTIDGVQAEHARIPFARNSVYRIPDSLTDEQVLFLTDILATGYEVGVLNGKVQPGDTLFVFVRAVNGPPMPLAVARLKASDLPARVTLTDAMAMTPAMTLSKFHKVSVAARISRTGDAMPQAGDLESSPTETATDSHAPITLTIDKVD